MIVCEAIVAADVRSVVIFIYVFVFLLLNNVVHRVWVSYVLNCAI